MKYFFKTLFFILSVFCLAIFLTNTAKAECPAEGCGDDLTCVDNECVMIWEDDDADEDENDRDNDGIPDSIDPDISDSGNESDGDRDGIPDGVDPEVSGNTESRNTGTNTEVVRIESPIDIDNPTELAAVIVRANTMIIGLVAVAAMIYAGFLYFTSGGNEERAGMAKKTITYAILGLVITILSYVIINTLINAIGG